MAEHYGIIDIDSIPVGTLSILAAGLPSGSRSMSRISGQKLTLSELLLATIADRLGTLIWMQSKDGHHNRNRPKSILQEVMNPTKKDDVIGFDSIEAYEAARSKILRRGENE